ncbi:MAG: galactokinase [Chloroflexi bacterium]|nr:galactokinase [Chloroflexota bacterium]
MDTFTERFGAPPTALVRAPGRVNLIGEHTDYNDGFVLPMALDRALWIALRPRDDDQVVLHALDFDDSVQIALPVTQPEAADGGLRKGWSEYVRGVAWALHEAGLTLRGWEGVIASDVPMGAGLSSSAAIELATARAFATVSGLDWHAAQFAQIAQRAENAWVGVKSGIMDQLISAAGVAGHAVLIDCRWLTLDPVPLPPETQIVILDTATRRELVGSAYNERRAQCEAAARSFGVPALRDVTLNQFEAAADALDPVIQRRARHVITENARTLQAAAAMRTGDPVELGRLMDASHISMRDDFEISRPEMDRMVEIAQAHPASFGARMTGGGFGGCAVALVRAEAADPFSAEVAAAYTAATGLEPKIYISAAADGAELISVPTA